MTTCYNTAHLLLPQVVGVVMRLVRCAIHLEESLPISRVNDLRVSYNESFVNEYHVVGEEFGTTISENIVIVPITHHFIKYQDFGLYRLVMAVSPLDVLDDYYIDDIILVGYR